MAKNDRNNGRSGENTWLGMGERRKVKGPYLVLVIE
jgi:hypothetical protein